MKVLPPFGGGALMCAGGLDAFVLELVSTGSHVWSHEDGDAAAQSGNGVATDDTGVRVTDVLAGAIDFWPGLMTVVGGNDVLVARLSP